MERPTFGIKQGTLDYQTRLAAYLIVSDLAAEKMILVQAPNGAYFLPGGEIEAGESKAAAIHREVMEELGYLVEIGEYLGQADEYFYSNHRQTAYYNPGYFYVAKSWQEQSAPLETTNQLAWFSIQEACQKLKRGSHQWAVQQWQKQLSEK